MKTFTKQVLTVVAAAAILAVSTQAAFADTNCTRDMFGIHCVDTDSNYRTDTTEDMFGTHTRDNYGNTQTCTTDMFGTHCHTN